MSKQANRNTRVADQVQRELAAMLQREPQDPQFGMITVSAVDLSPDLRNARIFVTCLGNKLEHDRIIEHLNGKAGHYRHGLAKVLALRVVPRLTFKYDSSVARGNRLAALIDSLSGGGRGPADDNSSQS